MKSFRLVLSVILAALAMQATGAPVRRPAPLTGGFDPEDVLVNLEQRIQDRDWKRYGDFLAPDFRFVPFSAVEQDYPSVKWNDWGRKQEIRFIQELVSPGYTASLNLRDRILDRGHESRDRAEWDLVYTLTSRGETFKSRAIFVFARVDNLWFLLEWIDTTIETDRETGSPFATSGTLRGALSR